MRARETERSSSGSPGAASWLKWIWLLPVLILSTGCASAPESCPEPERIEVAVRVKLDPKLLEECGVDQPLPQQGPLPFRESDAYLRRVEDALEKCAQQIRKIRSADDQ